VQVDGALGPHEDHAVEESREEEFPGEEGVHLSLMKKKPMTEQPIVGGVQRTDGAEGLMEPKSAVLEETVKQEEEKRREEKDVRPSEKSQPVPAILEDVDLGEELLPKLAVRGDIKFPATLPTIGRFFEDTIQKRH
jgi:hypothetical protein